MRAWYVGAVVLVCCARPAYAAPQEVVHLTPRWRAGDACDLEITRTFEDRRHDGVTTGRLTTRVRLTVRQAGADGYVLQWRFLASDAAPTAYPAAAKDALQWIGQQVAFEAHLDARGHVTALLEPAAARARLVQAAAAAPLPPATRDAVTSFLRSGAADDKAVDRLLTDDLRNLTTPLGQPFRVGRVIRYTDKLPNPMGGGTVAAKGEISLTKYDRAAGTATISADMTADPEGVRAVLARGSGRPLSDVGAKAVRDAEISVGNRIEHVIDVATGWPVRLRKRDLVRLGAIGALKGLQVTATLRPAGSPAADAR